MLIMKAKIIKKDKNNAIIEWSGETGFGQLIIKYNGNGSYKINAEYVGIETLLSIMNSIKL